VFLEYTNIEAKNYGLKAVNPNAKSRGHLSAGGAEEMGQVKRDRLLIG
jgi:hypothetical protein